MYKSEEMMRDFSDALFEMVQKYCDDFQEDPSQYTTADVIGIFNLGLDFLSIRELSRDPRRSKTIEMLDEVRANYK